MRLPTTARFLALAALVLAFQGCTVENYRGPKESEPPESWQHHLKPMDKKDLSSYPKLSRAYVPVYSHIYTEGRDRVLNLAETVSVRNTDDTRAIVISSVRYQSNTGKLIREYVPKPVLLDPMAAADFIVRLDDTSGGSGASFVIDWQADKAANPPLIEAIMISTGSGRNLSFVCRGIELPPPKPGQPQDNSGASKPDASTATESTTAATNSDAKAETKSDTVTDTKSDPSSGTK